MGGERRREEGMERERDGMGRKRKLGYSYM